VIEDRQKAVGVGGKVTANEIGCLVDDVVKKSWVLMGEAVVILLHTCEARRKFRDEISRLQGSSSQTFSHFACWLNMESMMRMKAS